MKKSIIGAIIALVLVSCGGKNSTREKERAPFAESDLFDFDKAVAHIGSANADDKKEAKQHFLKAIDYYRNKKEIEKSLPLFTQSLLKSPEAKTYYEYGNALLETEQYSRALSAYHMAEKLDYSPLSKVLYNLACAYSLSKKEEEALKYLELAIQNGYTNGQHIMQDPDMEFARASERFKSVYESAMSGSVSPERALFDLYFNEFKETTFPFQLTVDKSQSMTFENAIGYDYEAFIPAMRDERFSRDVGNEFYYVARFPKAENYFLVIYAERGLWMDNPPINYFLCSYSRDGKIIDLTDVAGYPYYDQNIKAFKITDANSFEVKEYATVWEKDVNEAGYEDNKPVKRDLVSTNKYRINSNGRFVSGKPVLGLLTRRR